MSHLIKNFDLFEDEDPNKKYPELDSIATVLADQFSKEINSKVEGVKSEMPYKAQYVLEEVIKILESRV